VIRVELELWLGEELGDDFQVVSPIRSRALVEIREGATVAQLLAALASDHPLFAKRVFDLEMGSLRSDLVLLKNERLVARSRIAGETLAQGDRIRVVPVYAGG